MDEKNRGVTWKKVFDFVTEKKEILDKREGKWRGKGQQAPMGWLIFFRRTLECAFQSRSKVHLAKSLSPTLFERRYLFYSLQDDLLACHNHLKKKCYLFCTISVNFFLHKFILWFWNLCTFLVYTTSTARTPTVQHGNAKNHWLLFKSPIFFSHLVFLILLLEGPALSQYLFFLLSSICLKNTFRSRGLHRDSYPALMIPLHHENEIFISTTYFLCIKQLSSHKDFDPESPSIAYQTPLLVKTWQ